MKAKITIIYLIIDLVLIAGCLFLPYVLRYNPGAIGRFLTTGSLTFLWLPSLDQYSVIYLFWAILIFLIFFPFGLYETRREISYLDEAILVLKALFFSSLPIAGAVFFLQVKIFSRLVFFQNLGGLALSLILWRILKRYLVRHRVARGFNNRHVLIVGAGKVGRAVAQEIARERFLGLEVVGFLDDHPEQIPPELRVLGGTGDLMVVVRREFVDEVLISIPSERDLVARLIDQARRMGKSIRVVPDLLSMGMEGIKAGYLGRIPLLEYYGKGLHGADLLLKRGFDIVISFFALLLLSPLLAAIAIAIKLTSPGPAIYVSRRNGKKGQLFNFYKFRTMVPGAEGMLESLRHLDETDGPIFKIRNDPRVTRVGKFLRRYSLDELPQLWNVLRGDMSLVGPRPPTPNEVEQYADWQLKRLEIRPGLTCLWQVKGRSNLSFREWMKFDLFYIENWSFWLDIKIILRTILVVFKGQGAY
ncbi:MAG: sugar transferase [Candidatus Erginobacter occultus]|nr:sugar transferase [Candidatus Erginobacter occultus]